MDNVKERYDGLARAGFNSRATYLAWVMDWKGYYRELSSFIRETRAEIKESQRKLIFGPPLWKLIRRIDTARHYATAALLLREHSKKEAAYQVMIVMKAERLHQAAESGELRHVGVVGSTILVER